MDPRTTPAIPSVMRGAVDLSPLRDRAAAATRPPARPGTAPDDSAPAGTGSAPANGAPAGSAPAGAPANGGPVGSAPSDAPVFKGDAGGTVAIIDVTEATFQSEVLERSLHTPVVIDFWAEWCGPCKQLSPILEKLAIEGGGSWVLARVDVDANPRLAQMFRVQGIPMVYAVIGGQPVDAFTGVYPEAQLRQWIGEVLKAGGMAAPIQEDPAMLAADDALAEGDYDAAERAYKKILADRPADAVAAAGLAQVGLLRRVDGVDPAQAIAAAAQTPNDVEAQLVAADLEVLAGRAEQAYQRLVELVRRIAGDDREKARTHLISLFTIAAPDDPAVTKARRALASALY
jgi:putative thioredoxin